MPQANRMSPRPAPAGKPVARPKAAAPDDEDGWALLDSLHVLVYGQSGTGKTTFWSSFPGPILCLICSGSDRPGEMRSIDTPEMRKKVTAKKVRSFQQFREVVAEAEGAGYGTVVLDHVTGFCDLVLSDILGRPTPEQKSWGDTSQQEYGRMSLQVKESLRGLLNLPCNVVIVGQERVFKPKDDGGGSDLVGPMTGVATTPSIAGWLNPACDYVVQTFKRGEKVERKRKVGNKEIVTQEPTGRIEYCMLCSPHESVMTKFRKPGGIDGELILVDPTYDKMLEAING